VQQRQAHEQQLEQHPLLTTPPETGLRVADRLQHPQQIRHREDIPPRLQLRQHALGGIWWCSAKLHGELRANQVCEAAEEGDEVHSGIRQPCYLAEHVCSAPLGDQVENREVLIFRHQAECLTNALGGYLAFGSERENLVCQAECVAKSAVGGASDHAKGFLLVTNAFLVEHEGKAIANFGGPDALEVDALETAEHRCCRLGDLLRV